MIKEKQTSKAKEVLQSLIKEKRFHEFHKSQKHGFGFVTVGETDAAVVSYRSTDSAKEMTRKIKSMYGGALNRRVL